VKSRVKAPPFVQVSVMATYSQDSNSELEQKIIPDIHPFMMRDLEIEIKQEVDIDANANEVSSELECDMGIPHNDLNQFFLDILLCRSECDVCNKYLKILTDHVKSSHGPSQSTSSDSDPLQTNSDHFEPDVPQIDQPSFIQIKCEVDETKTNEFESSQSQATFDRPDSSSSALDQDFLPKIEVESEPDYKDSSHDDLKCPECDKEYSTKGNLKIHIKTHTKKKHHSCNECEERFSFKCQLKAHMRLGHTQEIQHKNPFVCTVSACGKRFPKPCKLKEHMRIHTGHKPYTCDLCDKSFRIGKGLSKHRKIHSGERPYACDECEMRFITNYSLKTHKIAHKNKRKRDLKKKKKDKELMKIKQMKWEERKDKRREKRRAKQLEREMKSNGNGI